jgi:hypothetical protein
MNPPGQAAESERAARLGWYVVPALVGAGLALAAFWRPAAEPDPNLARLVDELEARPTFYRSVLCAGLARVAPVFARSVPRWFDPTWGRSDRRRVEAHARLLALGQRARPACARLVRAYVRGDSMGRTYALVVLAHVGLDEAAFWQGVRAEGGDPERVVGQLGGVLADEDERLRLFAWRCLELAGPAAQSVAPRLRSLRDAPALDPGLRGWAAAILAVADTVGE